MSENAKVCWILGRRSTLSNGHTLPVQPFYVFMVKAEACAAYELVADISGETPMLIEAQIGGAS